MTARIVIAVAAFASAPRSLDSQLFSVVGWRSVPFEFLAAAVVLFVVLTVNRWLWGNAWTWNRPAWRRSFINLLEPWQLFHASVFWIASFGMGLLVAGALRSPTKVVPGAFFLSAAAGLHLGLSLFIARNRERFDRFTDETKDNPYTGIL